MSDPTADQALEYVTGAFGLDPSLIGSLIGSPGSPGILAEMSHVLNATALLAATAIMVWGIITGVMDTGRRGKVSAGGNAGGIWVPMRQIYAISLLVPIIKGYSIVQVMVLLFAYLGWQAADQAWSAALGFLQNEGPVVNTPAPGAGDLGRTLLASHLCMIRANSLPAAGPTPRVEARTRTSRLVAGHVGSDVGLRASPTSYSPLRAGAAADRRALAGTWTYALGMDGARGSGFGPAVCGRFLVQHPATPTLETSGRLHREAVRAFEGLSVAANELAYDMLSDNPPGTSAVVNRLTAAVNQYDAGIRRAAAGAVTNADTPMAAANARFFEEAKAGGWITAGGWYWTISAVNQRIADLVRAQPAVNLPDLSAFPPALRADVDISLARLDRTLRNHAMTAAGEAGSNNALAGREMEWSECLTHPLDCTSIMLSRTMGGGLDGFAASLGGDGEALSRLQGTGHWFVAGGEGLFAAGLGAQALASTSVGVATGNIGSKIVNFVSGGADGVREGLSRGIAWITTVIAIVAFYLLFLGVLLAYYLPAIPYLLWVAGIFGWLAMLLEAMVAVPFWAAAHATMEGEGMAGQRARQGYMLVIGLVARPLLMVFGLIGSLIVAKYGAMFLAMTFAGFARGMHTGHTMGVVSFLAMATLLVIAAISGAKYAFGLIYQVPDRALRWIGGGVEQLGERGMEQDSHGYVVAAIGRTREGVAGAQKADRERGGQKLAKGGEGDKGAGQGDGRSSQSDDKHLP